MKLRGEVLRDLINKGDRVLVAVSGGADSMCLLHLVKEWKSEVDFYFAAVHVNHNLRGSEAKRDEEFVSLYCEKNNIDFISKSVDVLPYADKNQLTVEEAARELRYAAFDEVKKEFNFNKIAVAHNEDDQTETILMHIARGSSLKGARGMGKEVRYIIRPLIDFSRKEIEKYNKEHNVPCIFDSTNDDTSYRRNYIRKEIIPAFKRVYPGFSEAICTFSGHCREDDEFIESLVPYELIVKRKDEIRLLSDVYSLHISLKTRIIKRAFELLNIYADIEQKHILSIAELFKRRTGASISLPHGLYAIKEYDGIVISARKQITASKEIVFALGETIFDGFGKIYISEITDKDVARLGDGNHYLDKAKLPLGAVWRTRRDGDMFAKLGSGKKKLNDYFTDKKVPKRERDSVPVLAAGSNILAVAGLDISENAKITGKTKNIVKIVYQKDAKA